MSETTTMEAVTEETLGKPAPATRIAARPSTGDAAMAARFRRLQAKQNPQEVVFEFTKDPGLLHQYYLMREQMFISVWGLDHFHGQEDEFDSHSHILVARKGNQVVGGARLTVRSPRVPQSLPMEGTDFSLKQLLPDLNLENKTYAEISRVAVLPEFRDEKMLVSLYTNINRKALVVGLDYAFAIAPILQARNTRKIISMSEIDYAYSIRQDIAVPDREEYEGIKMYFTVLAKKS